MIKYARLIQYRALYKEHLGLRDGNRLAIMTGVSAGLTEALIVATPELIKIRMQDKSNLGKFKGAYLDLTQRRCSTLYYQE
jgi:solute carrier family 25 2-oxodicarboxylate transporter 21